MPLQDWMKIISVDDHVIEHPRVWQDRLSAKRRQDGPDSPVSLGLPLLSFTGGGQ